MIKYANFIEKMPKTYIDPVKEKSREKLYEFIKRNLDFKNPLEMKVMCFPGAEQEGEEALEVKEIYDRLGIPRQNIFGLELCPQRAELLRRANLGINVCNIDVHDFIRDTDETFDIISLDYTGKMGAAEVNTLKEIARSRKLQKNAVLMTNYFGARENVKEKINYYCDFVACSPEYIEGRDFDNNILALIDKKSPIDLAKMRDGISNIILGIMLSGKYSSGVTKDHIFFNSPVRWIAENNMRMALQILDKDKLHNTVISELRERGIAMPESINELCRNPYYSGTIWAYFQREALAEYFSPIFKENIVAARGMVYLLEARHCGGYFNAGNERYRYISNSRSPMLMDIFYFRSFTDILKQIDDIFSVGNGTINYNPLNLSTPNLNKKVRSILKSTGESLIHQEFNEREFLGSSYVSQKKERLPKEDLIYLIQSGIPTEEIISTYSGHTKMEIVGIKSWLTKRSRL